MATKKRRISAYDKASMARLAAVQAYYQILQRAQSPHQVINQYVLYQLMSDDYMAQPNVDLFRQLAFDAYARRDDIKPMIENSLTAEWRYERLEMVLKAILYVATAEMLNRPTPAPAPVIIMEYTRLTSAYYQGKEIAFINGYLDRLARHLNYPMQKDDIKDQPETNDTAEK
ncbi:MAG: transcription antitermination factor NusB [Janthinobacterium lividum]